MHLDTWLRSNIDNQEIAFSGYFSCRLDWNKHGGGLVILYRSTLGYKLVLSGSNDIEFSTVSCNLYLLYFIDYPILLFVLLIIPISISLVRSTGVV